MTTRQKRSIRKRRRKKQKQEINPLISDSSSEEINKKAKTKKSSKKSSNKDKKKKQTKKSSKKSSQKHEKKNNENDAQNIDDNDNDEQNIDNNDKDESNIGDDDDIKGDITTAEVINIILLTHDLEAYFILDDDDCSNLKFSDVQVVGESILTLVANICTNKLIYVAEYVEWNDTLFNDADWDDMVILIFTENHNITVQIFNPYSSELTCKASLTKYLNILIKEAKKNKLLDLSQSLDNLKQRIYCQRLAFNLFKKINTKNKRPLSGAPKRPQRKKRKL